ncbi:MAG TPA: ABC transporter permease subunit, partial [Ktedonobacteraceae bacterium]|nr:ABC transporter permease subunit [Ktedonobacteraceae bacterium]
MMFRTIWSKTLRDYRIPIIAWGLGIAFLLFAVFAAYTQIQGTSSTATLNQLAQSARFLADPIDLGTPAGYATWRVMSFSVPILLAIWALLAGARLIRGEEERGALDLLLSTPRSRMRLLIEKVVALIVALLIIGLLIGLGAI